jgi:hypothetical protein
MGLTGAIFVAAMGASMGGAVGAGGLWGASGFLGARIGEWLLQNGFADQPDLDPGQTEHLTEITYAATSLPHEPPIPHQ